MPNPSAEEAHRSSRTVADHVERGSRRRVPVSHVSVRCVAACLATLLLGACGGDRGAEPAAPPVATGEADAGSSSPATSPATTAASDAASDPATSSAATGFGNRRTGPSVTAGPITATPGSVDFGLVAPKTVVEATFVLRNDSDAPIRILASQPTCQCTAVEMAGEVVPARGSLAMPVSMETSGAVGVKQAAVSMIFEGVDTPMRVGLQAEVAYSVVARPVPYITTFGPGNQFDPARLAGTFRLESVDGEPFEVRSVQGETPSFVGFDPASESPRSAYELRYDFRGLAANAVPKYLLVETDREDCPLVDLRVRHPSTRIAPAFKFAQFRSMLGRAKAGEPTAFSIEVEEMGSTRFDMAYALSPDATADLVSQRSDGKNLLVTVEVTPRKDFTGLLEVPVTFVAGGRTSEHIVYGLVE